MTCILSDSIDRLGKPCNNTPPPPQKKKKKKKKKLSRLVLKAADKPSSIALKKIDGTFYDNLILRNLYMYGTKTFINPLPPIPSRPPTHTHTNTHNTPKAKEKQIKMYSVKCTGLEIQSFRSHKYGSPRSK